MILQHKFVEFIPDVLEENILYVSMEYGTAVHKCACGCSYEIVTPLAPGGWQLYYDGIGISLLPSIGNWNIPCRSHYYIKNNTIEWAGSLHIAKSVKNKLFKKIKSKKIKARKSRKT